MHTFQCAFFLPIKLTFYNTFGTINDNTFVIKVKLLFMLKKFLALFILAPIFGISQKQDKEKCHQIPQVFVLMEYSEIAGYHYLP